MSEEPLNTLDCCWNCKYARDADESQEQTGTHQATTSNYLLCKRYPPTIWENREHFPQVAIREWCGEYASARRPPRKRGASDV